MFHNPSEWWLHPGFHILNNQFTTHDQKSSNTTFAPNHQKYQKKKKTNISSESLHHWPPWNYHDPLQIGHSKKTIPSSNHEKTLLPPKKKWIQPNTQPRTPKQKTQNRTWPPKKLRATCRTSLSDLVVFWQGIFLIQGETFASGPWYQEICIAILEVKKKTGKMKVFHWVDDFLRRES